MVDVSRSVEYMIGRDVVSEYEPCGALLALNNAQGEGGRARRL